MAISSAATAGFFGSMPRTAVPELDIPIVLCPRCTKQRPMTIKAVVPHLRMRDGAAVAYICPACGTSEHRTVKPS